MSELFKVGIVGPECTGKSSLAVALSAYFKTDFVPEIARVYIDELNRPYAEKDLLQIAMQQCRAEDRIAGSSDKILICDTTLLVVKIWSEVKYRRCHPWILDEEKKRKYDFFLLMNIDLPWIPDPQREHPHYRQELFDLYHSELLQKNISFEIISGLEQERVQNAVHAVENKLKLRS